jgi:hypothetical protein
MPAMTAQVHRGLFPWFHFGNQEKFKTRLNTTNGFCAHITPPPLKIKTALRRNKKESPQYSKVIDSTMAAGSPQEEIDRQHQEPTS